MESEKIKETINEYLKNYKDSIINFLKDIIRINSINPRLGGPGEKLLGKYIQDFLSNYNFFNIKNIFYEDYILGNRPNIIVQYEGQIKDKNIYIITHMDTTNEGDLNDWKYHPFEPFIHNNNIYGLGAETKQNITTGIFSLILLSKLDILPKYNINLVILSDEETGSDHGIKYLLEKNYFNKDDLCIVLDSGSADGGFIEIAEKSVLWLKIEAFGKQTHSSTPIKGKNSTKAIINFSYQLINYLYDKYNDRDPTFENPFSSFEPTLISSSTDNINTIPGYTKLFIDSRILPKYDIENIIIEIKKIKENFEKNNDIKLKITFPFKFQSIEAIDKNNPFLIKFKDTLCEIKNIDIRIGGHAKLTLAAFLRKAGIPALAWCTTDNTSHQPNEYCYLKNLFNDIFTLTYFFTKF